MAYAGQMTGAVGTANVHDNKGGGWGVDHGCQFFSILCYYIDA